MHSDNHSFLRVKSVTTPKIPAPITKMVLMIEPNAYMRMKFRRLLIAAKNPKISIAHAVAYKIPMISDTLWRLPKPSIDKSVRKVRHGVVNHVRWPSMPISIKLLICIFS